MRCYRRFDAGEYRLLARVDGSLYDLTAADDALDEFTALARRASRRDVAVETYARRLLSDAELAREGESAAAVPAGATVPLVPDEVWAAGVTYEISEEAREAESGMPEIYLDVYRADRPELFFKATAERTVGPDEAIGIRGDSDWNVPEPELAIVLHEGEIVGYTIGNDVSSREIEGENPLYLPQAKIYDRCCALGPCVVPATVRDDWNDLAMRMTIERDGSVVFDESTSTSEMVRSHDELVSYLLRHDVVPESTVLLTGTSLVPPDDFTLAEGDAVEITIEGIGTLANPVTTV
ncbi:fumarylacetoacetate hydrolase family protein [Halovivax sp.]|uniref:fumarylacetoacetate hydrolase family protein n=1 Tax=Halovivax sp. TaxID=1935978 RepID=UPI0025BF1E4C|nr:fumarylacetoacetate hydrolase family protein [Halovivax sp.]